MKALQLRWMFACLAAGMAASQVRAQEAARSPAPISAWRVSLQPDVTGKDVSPIRFSFARTATGQADEAWSRWREAGVARTAVGGRFGEAGAAGSAGFLCGLQPTPQVGGAAEARGSDPQGRFLGAQLTLPLK